MRIIKITLIGILIFFMMVAVKPIFNQQSSVITTNIITHTNYSRQSETGKYALLGIIGLLGVIVISNKKKSGKKI